MDKLEFPQHPEIQGKIIEGQLENESKREERGLMGRIWGGGAEKPGNIIGFVIAAFVIMFACVLFLGAESASFSKKDALTIIGGFVTLGMGYLFGKSAAS